MSLCRLRVGARCGSLCNGVTKKRHGSSGRIFDHWAVPGYVAMAEVRAIWPDLDPGPAHEHYKELFEHWLEERSPNQIPDIVKPHIADDGSGSIIAGSVDELERLLALRQGPWMADAGDIQGRAVLEARVQIDQEVLGRIHHRTFTYLCQCEAELSFAATAATVFDRHRRVVDRHLATLTPDVLDKLNGTYRAAKEGDPESRSQALLSCRRVLGSIADVVFPAQSEPFTDSTGSARDVSTKNYRNRLFAFLDGAVAGDTAKKLLGATIEDFIDRVESLDDLSQKGVHDSVTQQEVDLCVAQTYQLAGEVLSLYERNLAAP